MYHLEKWNPATESFRPIASSNFVNLLRAKMYGLDSGIKYNIRRGGVQWKNIANNKMAQALINGLGIVDTAERGVMRGVNNKSKAVARANRQM